jgi:TonB family protein
MTVRYASFAIVAALVTALAQSPSAQNTAPAQPAPQPPPQTPSAQPPVDPIRIDPSRVTPPRKIKHVDPVYTAEAMRARIEGTVQLRAIVEADGSVQNVEVLRSLDQASGLDEEAIKAVKQWQFEPAKLDGTPIRVVMTVQMKFNVGPRTQAWPDGFSVAAAPADGVKETAEANGMRLTLTRPANWIVRPTGRPREWLGLRSEDGNQWISVLQPEGAAFDLRWPTPDPLVARVAEAIRRAQGTADAETLQTGQVQADRAFWVWSALRLPTAPNPPGPASAPAASGEARVWMFMHTSEGRVVGVSCTLLLPRSLDGAAIDARVRQAAAEFAPIVNSIAIEVLPG